MRSIFRDKISLINVRNLDNGHVNEVIYYIFRQNVSHLYTFFCVRAINSRLYINSLVNYVETFKLMRGSSWLRYLGLTVSSG